MPRRRNETVSPFQLHLGLEFARLHTQADYRAGALDLAAQSVDTGRFVRIVHEDVTVRSPSDAVHYFRTKIFTPFEQFEQEEFWVLLLNTKNRVTHEAMVYRGTANTIYIRVAEVFREAIRLNAINMIVAHCHPSGDPTPSPEDVRMTELADQAARLLDIGLLDHIVVGNGRWVSMKERGLGFKT